MQNVLQIHGVGCNRPTMCGPSEAAPLTLSSEPCAVASKDGSASSIDTNSETSAAWADKPLHSPHGSGSSARQAHDPAEPAPKRMREGAEPAADVELNKASLAHLLC
jgi:hypothetical protein